MVDIRGLTRRFGNTVALDDVSLAVEPGEILALLGHNGAGKTTMLRILNGLLRPTSGVVEVLGVDPTTDGQWLRTRTGVVPETPALDAFLTTRENLVLHGAIHDLPGEEVKRRSAGLLDELGLADKADVQARALSAGLKQRVALARALLHEPDLLLLDEPTSNLDPLAARQVRRLVRGLASERGTSVVLSTHNLAEAALVADRVAVIRHGRLLAVGTPGQLAPEQGTTGLAVTVVDDVQRCINVVAASGHAVLGVDEARCRAEVAVNGDDVPALVATLVAAGVAIRAVEPLEPTLEDIYVGLHHAEVAA